MKKTRLKFMVVPEELSKKAYVKNAVKIKIIRPDLMVSMGLLGDSGMKMAKSEFLWYFEKSLANKLISNGIAIAIEIKGR
jgi:hypothetical protein